MVNQLADKNDIIRLISHIHERFGQVDNKSSETIRGELTKKNITDALGYTPLTSSFDMDGSLADTD